MRKIIAASMAALTLAASLSAGSAFAQHRDDRRRDRDNNGAAVAAGIAGLAVGAALAAGGRGDYDSEHHYYRGYSRGGYYYGPSAYAGDNYYGSGYAGPRRCRTRTVWDPYVGAYIERTRCW